MHFLTFSAWPGRIHAYPQTFSVSLKSSLLYYSASSSEVQVSAPSIAVLTPPSSLPRWDMYKCTLYSILVHRLGKASGRLSHMLCIQAHLALYAGENIILSVQYQLLPYLNLFSNILQDKNWLDTLLLSKSAHNTQLRMRKDLHHKPQ